MCTVSMVFDHYNREFDKVWPQYPLRSPLERTPIIQEDLSEFRRLIDDFRQAVEAAKKVDRLTAQPDCTDPEKAKLEDRVRALEKRIAELEASNPT